MWTDWIWILLGVFFFSFLIGEMNEPSMHDIVYDDKYEDMHGQLAAPSSKLTIPSCKTTHLTEYRCNGDNLEQKYQYADCSSQWLFSDICPFGCENTMCKPCQDSDGGNNYDTKGSVYYTAGGKKFDVCIKDTENYQGVLTDYLREYSCGASTWSSELYECPYGCSDGECNQRSQGAQSLKNKYYNNQYQYNPPTPPALYPSPEPFLSGNIVCSSNVYNCAAFSEWEEAMLVFETCGGVKNDIHYLDGDADGIPCESLLY